ncbi:MAG: DUF4279 domain-containing protein [Candidatus Sericytochromatia bacterium]
MNKGYVYFGLLGSDFNPDIATERLGIQPTSVTYKGEPNELISPKVSIWRLSSPEVIAKFVDVTALCEEVIALLKDKAEEMKQLIQELNIEAYLAVVLWISQNKGNSMPGFHFNPSTLEFLSKVGARLEVDTYRGDEDE